MKNEVRTMTVAEVERQPGRTLLFKQGERNAKHWSYYVVARELEDVQEGDTIEYEEDAANFGWFIKVVSKGERN